MTAVDIAHVDDGPRSAPAVVLSGSLGSTLALWEPLLPSLRDFRVIRGDHRGHGGSPVPRGPYTLAELGSDVIRLLDRLRIVRASFCGVSLGGMAGMWLAANAPERVDRLVLLSTSARLGPAAAWHERARTVRRDGAEAVADAVVARWFTPGFRRREPDVVRSMTAMVASTPREGYAACCEAIAEWNFEEHLSRIRAPTLVIVGENDEATPAPHAHAIAGRISGARVVVLGDAAHVPIAEQPERLSTLVLAHLTARRSGEAA